MEKKDNGRKMINVKTSVWADIDTYAKENFMSIASVVEKMVSQTIKKEE